MRNDTYTRKPRMIVVVVRVVYSAEMWRELHGVLGEDVKHIETFFGASDDPMESLVARGHRLFPSFPHIVWQGDPATFAFQFVSADAEKILGYPAARWMSDLAFWSEVIVHPEDRDDAIAFCALATGKQRDHAFEYRAQSSSDGLVWLLDVVRVVRGARGVPVELRGIMFDVSRLRTNRESMSPLRIPTVAELDRFELVD